MTAPLGIRQKKGEKLRLFAISPLFLAYMGLLTLYAPVGDAVGRQLTAAAEAVGRSCEKIHGPACSGVKVSGVGGPIGIDRHQDPLLWQGPFQDDLPVGEVHIPVGAVTQRRAFAPGLGQTGNPIGESAPFRALQGWAKGVVPIGLPAQDPPFAALVQSGNARHPEEEAIGQGQMPGLPKDAGNALHIVVVQEAQEMLPLV